MTDLDGLFTNPMSIFFDPTSLGLGLNLPPVSDEQVAAVMKAEHNRFRMKLRPRPIPPPILKKPRGTLKLVLKLRPRQV